MKKARAGAAGERKLAVHCPRGRRLRRHRPPRRPPRLVHCAAAALESLREPGGHDGRRRRRSRAQCVTHLRVGALLPL